MKLLFTILLMFPILFNEVSSIFEIGNFDTCILDSSSEVETEKEYSENFEDLSEVKINQQIKIVHTFHFTCAQDLSLKWPISISYLEIHSPPPELG